MVHLSCFQSHHLLIYVGFAVTDLIQLSSNETRRQLTSHFIIQCLFTPFCACQHTFYVCREMLFIFQLDSQNPSFFLSAAIYSPTLPSQACKRSAVRWLINDEKKSWLALSVIHSTLDDVMNPISQQFTKQLCNILLIMLVQTCYTIKSFFKHKTIFWFVMFA